MAEDKAEPELPAKDDQEGTPAPQKARGYRFVPERPPPSREEMLRMLKANEPVSVGEIGAAVRDKRLTEEEAAEYLPGFYGKSARKELEAVVEKQREWSRTMEALGNTFREPLQAAAWRLPEERQLEATREIRAELAGIADVLKTSGEQIVTMASLAASTVANLERVYQETAVLRGALVEFKNEAATASGRLETLTRWLIAFTCAVVLLTVVLVVHDLTR